MRPSSKPLEAAEKVAAVTVEQGATSIAPDTRGSLPTEASLPTTSLPIMTVTGGSRAIASHALATGSTS
jgi:hypothetical protein